MRVGVDVVRASVCCPSGVTDTEAASWQLLLSQQLLQIAELAGFLGDVQRFIGDNCNPG